MPYTLLSLFLSHFINNFIIANKNYRLPLFILFVSPSFIHLPQNIIIASFHSSPPLPPPPSLSLSLCLLCTCSNVLPHFECPSPSACLSSGLSPLRVSQISSQGSLVTLRRQKPGVETSRSAPQIR